VLTYTDHNVASEIPEESEIHSERKIADTVTDIPLIVELSFGISGAAIPIDHGYELFSALAHFQAELHNLEYLSIQTITSTTFKDRKLLLTNHSKLRIRLPVDKVPLIYPLAGRSILIGSSKVRLGIPQITLLQPARSLYSRMALIKGKQEPDVFLKSAQQQLQRLGIDGEVRISVGSNGSLNRKTVRVRKYTVVGFGLEVLNLCGDDSLKLQSYGIGGKRKMGCGIFVPE